MISVNYLKERIEILARKAKQSGYATKAEFNSDLKEAQSSIYEFYYKIFEETGTIVDALEPFIVEVSLAVVNGLTDKPSDYRHRLESGYWKVVNADDCGDEPDMGWCPVYYLRTHEEKMTLKSPVRKPSMADDRLYLTYKNNKIRVWPAFDNLEFKYLKNPPEAKWESTITSTPTGDAEVYAPPPASIDLIWNESETSNFIDILLTYLGIETKSSELIEFVNAKRASEVAT